MLTKSLEKKLLYDFKDKSILIESLTHKSAGFKYNYERLEFLGDRVLGVIIAEKIYTLMSGCKVSNLHLKFESLTNEFFLSQIASDLNLSEYIIVQPGIEGNKFKKNPSILSDVIEALIGGIYIDGGIIEAKNFIENFFNIDSKIPLINPKSALQDKVLEYGLKLPKYNVLEKNGPDHNPIFFVNVEALGFYAEGKGRTIKIAEFTAAENLLNKIKGKNKNL